MELKTKLQQLINDNSEKEEVSTEPLIPILQTSLRNNNQAILIDNLNQVLTKTELEIEKLCYQHYQEFIQSFDRLNKVKVNGNLLKDKVTSLNDTIQNSGNELLAIKTELHSNRRVKQRLDEAHYLLTSCLKLLQLANKVNLLLSNKSYYSALKTLEQLDKEHLPSVKLYEFAKYMAECIPNMRDIVKQAVILEKREWLSHLNINSRKLGKLLLDSTVKKQSKWAARKLSSQPLINQVLDELSNLDVNEPVSDHYSTDTVIDFQPFYQCLHIHTELNVIPAFQRSFKEDRLNMANHLLESSVSLTAAKLSSFDHFLQDLVGFFKVECQLLATVPKFRYQADVDQLFELLVGKACDDISKNLKEARDENTLSHIITKLQACIRLLEDDKYDVRQLQQFLDAVASFNV